MKKESLLKFYQNYRIYIFPVIVAISSLILIVAAIYPQTAKLISNQSKARELINKSEFLEVKAQTLEEYDSADLARKLEIALSAYPGSKDFGAVIGLMQQVVAQSGFTISSIALGSSSKTSAGSQSYELKLDLIGVKPGLPILLNNLESSPRLIRVSSIDVSSTNNTQALTVALVVEVLYAALPQSFGSADSPLPEFSQKDEDLIARLARVGATSQTGISGPRGKSNPFE